MFETESTSYSPHAWGWTGATLCLDCAKIVFPTRVGMDRSPRTAAAQYSPHAWGWTDRRPSDLFHGVVFPTRVGMDRRGSAALWVTPRIPHTRGDGPWEAWCLGRDPKYSPHAWGWTADDNGNIVWCEVFPTRVGMDRTPTRTIPAYSAYSPHAWGWTDRALLSLWGGAYSPHAWGWTAYHPARSGVKRIPHTRGDGPHGRCQSLRRGEYSPHAWGWTGLRRAQALPRRVFPTRVGMDR